MGLFSLFPLTAQIVPQATSSPATETSPAGSSPFTSEEEFIQYTGKADWGQPETPGVKVTIRESRREKVNGTTAVTYVIQASGFPQGKAYTMWEKDSLRPAGAPVMTGFVANASGELVAPATSTREEINKFDITVNSFFLGEGVAVAILSDDKTVAGYTEATPFPIEARDNGCHVFVKAVTIGKMPPATAFLILGEGFEPGTLVESKDKTETDKNGRFRVLRIPYLGPEKRGGHVSDTFADSSCKVAVQFDWGTAAVNPEKVQ
jgi:hypothetical protein